MGGATSGCLATHLSSASPKSLKNLPLFVNMAASCGNFVESVTCRHGILARFEGEQPRTIKRPWSTVVFHESQTEPEGAR